MSSKTYQKKPGEAGSPVSSFNTLRPFAPARPRIQTKPSPLAPILQRAELDPETEDEETKGSSSVVQRAVDPDLAPDTRVLITAEKYKAKYQTNATVVRKSRTVADHLVVRYDHIRTPNGADGFRIAAADMDLAEEGDNKDQGIVLEGGATMEDVLLLREKAINVYNRAKGKQIHIWRVGGANADNVCHHYAFGGLSGDAADFSMAALGGLFGILYGDVPAFFDIGGETVDIGGRVAGVAGLTPFPVRVLDEVSHSIRQEGGRWWHKFNGLPFLVSVEGDENLGYLLTATLTVRSDPAPAGAQASFTVNE
jgi:hypothetical protein